MRIQLSDHFTFGKLIKFTLSSIPCGKAEEISLLTPKPMRSAGVQSSDEPGNCTPAFVLWKGRESVFREALNKSARAVSEGFCSKLGLENRRNTLCISRFSNRKVGTKDPLSAAADLFRASLV